MILTRDFIEVIKALKGVCELHTSCLVDNFRGHARDELYKPKKNNSDVT